MLQGAYYHGSVVDVWSSGVILYALLCGRLPFDDPHVPTVMKLASRAEYYIPPEVPQDAANLIERIFVVNQKMRIRVSLSERNGRCHNLTDIPGFDRFLKSYLILFFVEFGFPKKICLRDVLRSDHHHSIHMRLVHPSAARRSMILIGTWLLVFAPF
jgi:serine/threonine protein kinase